MPTPVLFVFTGLPGSGKSTIAQMLSTHFSCTFLRIDTIEQALRDLCAVDVGGEGYRLAYRIAADNLKIGISVVADSCNPIEMTTHDAKQVRWGCWRLREVRAFASALRKFRTASNCSPWRGLVFVS